MISVFRRIGLIGSIANPNFGDDAILDVTLKKIYRLYGENCKVYVFSKDASYTENQCASTPLKIISVDYLHRISVRNQYQLDQMELEGDALLESSVSSDNYEYAEIHRIFKQLDVLHIIGGGYINTLWKDMLYEVYLSCKLAKKYGSRILATGISIYPFDLRYEKYIREIINDCVYVDFRDESYKTLPTDLQSLNITCTCDDAFIHSEYSAINVNSEYLNMTFAPGIESSENFHSVAQNIIIPFLEKTLQDNVFSEVNILGFAPGDFKVWDEVEGEIPTGIAKRIHRIDFIGKDIDFCIKVLVNAKCNIGTRYHMAVLSLANGVPSYGIYFGKGYYQNKITELFKTTGLSSFSSLDDVSIERLNLFISELPTLREHLKQSNKTTVKLYQEKNKLITDAYSVNKEDALVLKERLVSLKPIKVSIIVPVYNMEKYLQQCLDSILSQTLKEIEIICVNDGSSDSSQAILYENAWKDNRIRIIDQSNKGVASARNKGLNAASGEFVGFIDPDDWLADEKVLEDMYWAAKNHKTFAVGGQFLEYNEKLGRIITNWGGNLSRYKFDKEEVKDYKDFQFDFGWIRFIYNREFLIRNNLYFPDRIYFEDPVWFVKVMAKMRHFYTLTRNVYCYRTGFKDYSLSEEQVADLLKGVLDNIHLAEKEEYYDLLHLEVRRIVQDYCREVIKYINNKDNIEIHGLIDQLNTELSKYGYFRIDYEMYRWADFHNCSEVRDQIRDENRGIVNEKNMLEQKVTDLSNQINELYHSLTWKTGNAILYVPKYFARKIRHE
jgi:glycosyltransferase involved in cell wall biosynthesis/polysaccharide pyruvyl transferase WcaK-like protein